MSTKKQELESQINELESSLANLKQQLHQMELSEQHEALEDLDNYLLMLDHKWENLRTFWPLVLKELREMFANVDSNTKGD